MQKLISLVQEGRKLVTIRKVDSIEAIKGADKIEISTIGGWDVITRKGEYQAGDLAVFFEIDSFIPVNHPAFSFLSSSSNKVDEDGIERARLRTRKLRGVVSQGLLIKPEALKAEISTIDSTKDFDTILVELEENCFGIEEFIGVTKYERPLDRNSNGGGVRAQVAGVFPPYIPKTDEERIQNVYNRYSEKFKDVVFKKSLKLDGSSCTVACVSDESLRIDNLDVVKREFSTELGELVEVSREVYPFQWEDCSVYVASRNMTLRYEKENNFWKAVESVDMIQRLKDYCTEYGTQLAIQGEVLAPNIQGNPENLLKATFFAFKVWDITKQEYLDDKEFIELCNKLEIQTVPQLGEEQPFLKYSTVKEMIAAADIPSMNAEIAEGVVYKSVNKINNQTIHFKVINNRWLMEVEE